MDWNSIKAITIPEGNVKQIAKGSQILWKSGPDLPYRELKWIQSDGNQYIDTNIQASNTRAYEMDFMFKDVSSGAYTYFMGTLNNPWCLYMQKGTVNKIYNYIGNSHYIEVINTDVLNHRYKAKMERIASSFKTYIDDVVKDTFTYSSPTFNQKIFIGSASAQPSPSSALFNGNIYSFKVWNMSNILVMDMIPCIRKSDNVVCMYDKVSETFFTNAGTGNFIAGDPV